MKWLACALAVTATSCKKDPASDPGTAGGSNSTKPAAHRPPAPTAAISGVLPASTRTKMQDAGKKTHAKAKAKAQAVAKKAKGKAKTRPQVAKSTKRRGPFVEAIPRKASKAGGAKHGKQVAKAPAPPARPPVGRTVRTRIHADGTFRLQVPAADYLLVFYDDFDEPIGSLVFPASRGGKNSALLPCSHAPLTAGDLVQVNLGSIDINIDNSSFTFVAEHNPLLYFDSDGDGENDFADLDDDGDGSLDLDDLDADGDGLDDGLFAFDADGDGVLDPFDDDDDNDGIADIDDADEDGDGIDDASEADDVDGDGIEDAAEAELVDDDDGDGIPNEADNDDDNDGVADDRDNDADNDGIPDDREQLEPEPEPEPEPATEAEVLEAPADPDQ